MMKIYFLFLWLSLFFISNAFGQSETRLSQRDWYIDYDNDGDFIIRTSDTYSYFPSGKIKEEINDRYNQDGIFEERIGTFYTYNDDESLLLRKIVKRYNATVNLWVTENWTDYSYDVNGCEIKQEFTINAGGFRMVLEFEVNANCQITKETQWTKQPAEDTLSKTTEREFTYLPDGISYDEDFFRFDFFNGEKFLWRRLMYRYNTDGQLEESQEIDDLHLNNDWTARKEEYSYDDKGNVISRCNFINRPSFSEWSFNNKYDYQNEYDNQNRLIKKTSKLQFLDGGELVTSPDSEIVRDYEYECEDWVLQETSARVNVGVGNGSRIVNHYEGMDECFEIENIALEMSIYPNPTLGNITINSPVFQSGNTMISVFDISGKLLLEKNEIRRVEKTEVDLSHLSNGMYVVQLMNQEHFVQQKVVLTK